MDKYGTERTYRNTLALAARGKDREATTTPQLECRHCHQQGFATPAALLTHLGIVHADYYQTYRGGRMSIIA